MEKLNTKYIIFTILVILLGTAYFFFASEIFNFRSNQTQNTDSTIIMNFEDCAMAGYPVMESYPRQCKTPDGRMYAEEIPEKITYTNADDDMIKVSLPFAGAVVGKNFSVIGEARGMWFFEASFPVELLDKDGKTLAIGVAQAQSEWMTENFVPFKADLKAPEEYIGKATLILKKDNPSGLKEKDAQISIPITVEY